MKLRAVDLRDPALTGALRERLCWLYYDEIYRAAFPIADEAEDPSIWLPLIADTQPPPLPIVHLVLAVDDAHGPRDIDASALFGGIIFEYFRISKASLATYLCIKPEMRGHGVARFLIARALDIIGAHAPGVAVPLFAEAAPAAGCRSCLGSAFASCRSPIVSRPWVPASVRSTIWNFWSSPMGNRQASSCR
jgi:GNAT superfamily N-acetyltransferase